ncbi:MAG: SGNH/GDSL hydrolase family protein [Puniceicoccales bacterium]
MKSIVGFGASSMQGVGDSQGGFFSRVARRNEGSGLVFHNLGIGGNTLAEMLERRHEVPSLNPAAIVVMLGCNDLPRVGDGTPERRSNVDEYTWRVDQLLASLDAPQLFFISSFAVSEELTGVSPAVFAEYMTVSLEAATRHGYDVWDFYGETRDEAASLWAEDGLHVADDGHERIAQGLETWIAKHFPAETSSD